MKLEQRLERLEDEDLLIIGEKVQQFLDSELGKLFKNKLLPNLQKMEIERSRDGKISADRALGRIEAYNVVLSDLENFVASKKELERPIRQDNQESPMAVEQTVSPVRGGEI
jgi:hypothetical protein